MGHSIRSLYKDRLEPALPLWYPLLPRSNPGDVSVLPADERRGVFRTEAGRADVHGLLVARKRAVRDNHYFGRKGDNREEAVSILDERDRLLAIQILGPRAGDLL